MAKTYGVGIIGAGNISAAYLRLAPLFRNLEVRAIADILPEAAKKRAEEYKVAAQTPDELLKNSEIDVVVNLTIPATHFAITKDILSAGKHAYSEKPFVLSVEEGIQIKALAEEHKLKVGSAPDTFLGGSHQQARSIIDSGKVGRIASGTMHVMSRGMEHWHPNPDFFFQPGGGPILDLGPYYITDLISLVGPIKRVSAFTGMARAEREVTAEGPYKGTFIKVGTPTTIHAILEFHSGAIITLGASWDVASHGHHNIELYGTEGSVYVPDPNFFAGTISLTEKGSDYRAVETGGEAFGAANWPFGGPFTRANYRMLGVADLVDAAAKGREPRCSGRLAAHVVEVMESILVSAAEKRFIRVRSGVERPAPLTAADAKRFAARTA